MLPDLRIVIAAVLSTFVLSAGVGFYASSRLIGETKKATDSIASFEETPVNRIALSWPEPTRQPEPLALDFAVTAKALRNPVRDVTSEPAPAAAPPQPVRTTATDLAPSPRETPAQIAPSRNETGLAPAAAAPAEAVPANTALDAQKPVPEPDIRVAVQYPPVSELPQELRAPAAPVAAAAPPATEAPATTGSIAEEPKVAAPDLREPPLVVPEPELRIASRPQPAEAVEDEPAIAEIPLPKPAPKIATKKAAPKKAAAKKVVRRPVRRITPAVTDAVPNFFSFFSLQQPR
jgi:hypothetical protein